MLYQPEFQDMPDAKAGPGELAKVVCRVRASPDPDVFWAKKGEDGKLEKIDTKADKKWQRWVDGRSR